MIFEIDAVNRADGQNVNVVLTARNVHAAALAAQERGLDVRRLRVLSTEPDESDQEPEQLPVLPLAQATLPDGFLAYATARTDAELRQRSLDREMLMRLARAIGIGYALVGLILTLAASQGGASDSLMMFVMFALPGILLCAAAVYVRHGAMVPVVFTLVGGLWITGVTLFILAFLGYRAITDGDPGFLIPLLVNVLLLIPLTHLIFRSLRVMSVGDLRGGSVDRMLDVSEFIRIDWVREHLSPVSIIAAVVGIAANAMAFLAGRWNGPLSLEFAGAVGVVLWLWLLLAARNRPRSLEYFAQAKLLHSLAIAMIVGHAVYTAILHDPAYQLWSVENTSLGMAILGLFLILDMTFPIQLWRIARLRRESRAVQSSK